MAEPASGRGPTLSGAHPRGQEGSGGGARRRWRSRRDGCSKAGITPRSAQHPQAKLLPEPTPGSLDRERALLGLPPNPGGPAPTSPSLRRLGGAPGPRGSAPVGPTKPPENPLLATFAVSPVPPDSPSSPPGRREWRSPRPRVPAIGAGVSTSEQSPRPDVSAGTRTRTRRCAPARHLRSSSRRHRGVAPRDLRVPARQPAVRGPSSQAQGGPDHPGTPGRACRKTRARMQKLATDRRR